jgi:glycosyltransferase involved in cell wall biosynthesis
MKHFILLIPCYNNWEGLIRSLKSISYPPDLFEVMVVDDGSALPLSQKDLNAALPGTSITLIKQQKNSGVVNALNAGLQMLSQRSDYRFIARLDCGDICEPGRFFEQVRFLEENADVALVGSWCRFKSNVTGSSYLYIAKAKHEDILKEMHFKCSFIHPTVMFRREVLQTAGFYPTEYLHAEDYAFFWKIISMHKGAILPKVLLTVETRTAALSHMYYREQSLSKNLVLADFAPSAGRKWMGTMYNNAKLVMGARMVTYIKAKVLRA